MIICYHLIMVECNLVTLFLNPLSLVVQGTHKYVGYCNRFSVLHVNTSFATIPSSIIVQPLVFFNVIKIVLYQ